MPKVQEEEGCVEYGPTLDVKTNIEVQIPFRPNVVTVVEKWESLDALQDHLMAPHMMEYRERVKLLVANVSLRILEPA